MDSAINGVLQSLDPYSAYMNPELFKEMQTDTRGEFGGLGIEIGMEAGVVKVISPKMGHQQNKLVLKQETILLKSGKNKYREISDGGCETNARTSWIIYKSDYKKKKC